MNAIEYARTHADELRRSASDHRAAQAARGVLPRWARR